MQYPLSLEVSSHLTDCIIRPGGLCSPLKSPLSLQVPNSPPHCISKSQWSLESPIVSLVFTGLQKYTSLYLKSQLSPQFPVVSLVSTGLLNFTSQHLGSPVVPAYSVVYRGL